ncbi:MAG: 7-carboxy-7-deazaguanine synthase QueE [Paraclostridium sp.]
MNNTKKILPVMEIFTSIQGEGIFAGAKTYFIRFRGCDFNCSWCDEPLHRDMKAELVATDIKTIMALLDPKEARIVTLTGGNPCIHNLTELVRELKVAGFDIHIETQGTLMPDWLRYVDFITVSPKGPSAGRSTDLFKLQHKFKDLKKVSKQLKPVVMVDRYGAISTADIDYVKQLVKMFPKMYITVQLGDDATANPETYGTRYRLLCEKIGECPELIDVRVLPQLHKIGGIR